MTRQREGCEALDDDDEDGPGRLGDYEELDDDILAWVSTGFFTVEYPNDALVTRLVSHPCIDWLGWLCSGFSISMRHGTRCITNIAKL